MSGLSDFWMRPLLEDQTEESSLVTVKNGQDHVAAVEGVEDGDSDGVGLGVLDGVSELEVLTSAEAPAGSTVSCPLWVGPQALSARPAVRRSPRARR